MLMKEKFLASMKAQEVMEVLGICRQTLCNYVKQGLITIDSNINGKYRYNAESVYKLLNNSKTTIKSK